MACAAISSGKVDKQCSGASKGCQSPREFPDFCKTWNCKKCEFDPGFKTAGADKLAIEFPGSTPFWCELGGKPSPDNGGAATPASEQVEEDVDC
ncbi:hypothetical protein CDD83_1604 [Cordyceps sp. RAO-2017]|nr:hypothetical protein CDD83_1604 [Cordyceps sp. RAO-2017]